MLLFLAIATIWILATLATLIVGILAVLGVCWAPFGALTCRRYARRHQLNLRRYTLTAAIYSTLFLLPWIYFIAHLYNWRRFQRCIHVTYVLFYFMWVTPIVSVSGMLILMRSTGEPLSPFWMTVALLALNAPLAYPAWQLFRQVPCPNVRVESDSPWLTFHQVAPFVFAYFTMGTLLLFFVEVSPLSQRLFGVS